MDPLLSSVTGKLLDYKGRTLWRFYRKLGINLPYDPTNPLLVIYPDKPSLKKMPVPQCSFQHYLQ